jgi:hypothetical protein
LLDPGGTTSVGTAYSGGMLTFPVGSPQNGVFSTTTGAGQVSIPLPPGPATLPANGAGTTSPAGPVTGTTFLSTDGSFFYANLIPVNSPTQAEFIYGGRLVNQSFYAPTANNRFFAFNLQPDAALNSPIPFVTNSTGGSVAGPSVSSIYAIAPANTQFGSFNANTNPNVNSPHYLQASLGISGAGPSQTSVLVVSTGSFFTSTTTGTVVASGPVRGSFFAPGTSVPVQTRSAASTVPDGLNNNLFGSNTISGFVLDQNSYTATDSPLQQLAATSPLGGSTTNYAFNQPAVVTPVPSTITGVSRTTQTLSGSFGGIMYPNIVGSPPGSPYPATGNATVQTNAANNRLAATLSGGDSLADQRHTAADLFERVQSVFAARLGVLWHCIEQPSAEWTLPAMPVPAVGLLDRGAQYYEYRGNRGRPPRRGAYKHLGRRRPQHHLAGGCQRNLHRQRAGIRCQQRCELPRLRCLQHAL